MNNGIRNIVILKVCSKMEQCKMLEKYKNKIICGDCLEVMKNIPDKSIDLVLTDPPYGVNQARGARKYGIGKTQRYKGNWDNEPLSREYFDEILRVGKVTIIFGANCFSDCLPSRGHWIVWDKKGNIDFNNPFSDCELAWTSIKKKPIKKYTVIQQGFISKEKKRFHPTQKPVQLFKAIIKDYSKENDIILDPFLGSGTTAVAAKQLKRNFIGIEINPDYVKIAKQRLRQEILI